MSNQVQIDEKFLNDTTGKTLYGNRAPERSSRWDQTGSEKVINGDNNSFIILGRDRHASKASGKGGEGFTQCGKIDLVAGLNSTNTTNDDRENPNFFLDAARVYISQKSNVDRYFGLAKGSEEVLSDNLSCVAAKADHVRIIGRNHIKLVTGAGRINKEETDARGNNVESMGNIDFITGNNTEPFFVQSDTGPLRVNSLQPLVKGESLIMLLTDLISSISDIQNQVFANKKALLNLATNYAGHVHVSPFFLAPVPPSPSAVGIISTITNLFTDLPESVAIETNLENINTNYFGSEKGLYILSKSVRTT